MLNKSYKDELFMALIRWQPLQEMETLRRQMDQIFDEMTSVKRESQMAWKPAIELKDTQASVILRIEVPGVEGKDLDVRVTREAVAIAGEHRYENKAEEKGFFRTEFRYGKFQRVIPLPVAVENDKVQAQFKDGILTLTLPKVTEARRQVVKVNLADNTAAMAEANHESTQSTVDADTPAT